MANKYHLYNSIRVTATFKLGGVAADPTAVELHILKPDGTEVTYYYPVPSEITKSSTGIYYKEIYSDQVGDWHYEFIGTGAVVAADENHYIIEHSKFD